jgi:hypothetical protein
VTPKRGDRAAPPPATGEYELRFATTAAAEGWEELCRQAPGGMRRAWEHIRADPRTRERPGRQHRLRGTLGTGEFKGRALERWQYEVTGGGRVWYLVDEDTRTAWITHAGTGHPKATE